MDETTLALFAHPLSSFCQKALTALYENDTPFTFHMLDGSDPVASRFGALWPIGKFPVLTDNDRVVPEATIIIEYLAVHHPGPSLLIPKNADAAVEVRWLDRVFDNYVSIPQQRLVIDAMRGEGQGDPKTVSEAHALLDKSYAWLDRWMDGREWAAGGAFSMADCAAAPSLLYADWSYAIPEHFANLHAYRRRLLARPSYARALDEARPYRHMFPLGAPTDRD
ncbi:glutathione S-transferase family protein [Sphingomonas japonica]|uniref:Glutathione S-transferase n=1 Tax=Sphingomonas japonica TaxID=511662 RepID=A0ABX0TW75_9SPHN|nr:glutathione S-transferase family protein [Sphingomonas japonica]NIJ22576.1 glutathione S-transferase [Sphingomonas japonica]